MGFSWADKNNALLYFKVNFNMYEEWQTDG